MSHPTDHARTDGRSNGAPSPGGREARRAQSLSNAEALLRRPFVAGAIEFLCLGSYPKGKPTTALVAPCVLAASHSALVDW